MQTIKTREQWSQSGVNLSDFLTVGDYVDEAFIDWALSVMPPACWTSTIVQIGEPCSHVNGRATFTTFQNQYGMPWQYVGECHRNEFRQPTQIHF